MTGPRIPPRLLTLLFDGELDDADLSALNDALASSESARRQYVDAVYLREGLRRWTRSRGAADVPQVIKLASVSECLGETPAGDSLPTAEWPVETTKDRRPDSAESPRYGDTLNKSEGWSIRQLIRSSGAVAVVAASVLLVLAGLYLYQPWITGGRSAAFQEPWNGDLTLSEEDFALSESDTVVARLVVATPDIRWTRGRVPSDFLMRFRPGDILDIKSGIAQVEFSGGAHLVLNSPAALQFTGDSSARLMQGSVTGRAEETSFALVTPSATVVDIGTEFGVGVGPGGTDVTVFEGELQVHSLLRNGEGGPMRRVREGMSMRIDSNGEPVSLRDGGGYAYRRDLLRPLAPVKGEGVISLLDLVGGYEYPHTRIAGSIDPRSGYWGKPPWLGPDRPTAQRGDTQFTPTPWNRMVDGVFIPRSNAREMQIDSDGHMVYLPPNSGTSWGPIWARRRSSIDLNRDFTTANRQDHWGGGTLELVQDRLLHAREGLLGLHANVGITFDLNSVRESRRIELARFKALLVNLGASVDPDGAGDASLADLRIFVDGKLRYSRLEFSADDEEADVDVPLYPNDRFLTLVATDSDGDPKLDHVVFVDPVLHAQKEAPTARRSTLRNLYAVNLGLGPPPPNL